MSKRKVSAEDKIYAVNLYLKDKESQHGIASMFDVSLAENVLNREFYADASNEKWLTDVTEFKYSINQENTKYI